MRAANRYGVSPYALAAIARKETQFGKTAGGATNNAYGYDIHNRFGKKTAPSWDVGTDRVAKSLGGSLYKGAGLRSIDQILAKYAPSVENNTKLYISQARQWMKEMGGNPDDIFGGGGAGGGPVGDPAPPQPEQPTQNGGNNIAASVAGAIVNRQPGQSLFQSVAQGAIQSVLSGAQEALDQPAMRQRDGVTANPQGFASGEGSGVVNAAKRQLGVPYSWGGGTPSGPTRGFAQGANTVGFDCSSLVQHAWAKAGVKLPRTTYDQIKVGQGINASNMGAWRPGDLMFPSTGHVQMYIGNGKVIEAPRTGGHVQIVPVRSKYIAVRRPA